MKEKDQHKHNALVLSALQQLSKSYDVIVLAQESMFVMQDELHRIPVPVLTSPRLGVMSVRKALQLPD